MVRLARPHASTHPTPNSHLRTRTHTLEIVLRVPRVLSMYHVIQMQRDKWASSSATLTVVRVYIMCVWKEGFGAQRG